METYRDVVGYEGLYQVSDKGNVKSLDRSVYRKGMVRRIKGKNLKPSPIGSGYLMVQICKEGTKKSCLVHSLVAQAFLNHIPNGWKTVVDHIDNDKFNNNLSNLQLISQRENASKDKGGSSKYTGVYWCKRSNKWLAQLKINNKSKHLGYFTNELEAHNAYQLKLKTKIR